MAVTTVVDILAGLVVERVAFKYVVNLIPITKGTKIPVPNKIKKYI